MANYYLGRCSDGKGHSFFINGGSYSWNAGKYINNKCEWATLGQTFEAEYTIEDNGKGGETVTLDWNTFVWNDEVVEVDKQWIAKNAAGEKARSMKTNYNKIKDADLEGLTLKELRHGYWNHLNTTQKQCLLARMMQYMGGF